MAKLSHEEVRTALERLPGWRREGDTISRTYELPDFRTALAFVVFVGELAEQAGHHPDVELGWGKVRLALSTHSEGGLTKKDVELAARIDHR